MTIEEMTAEECWDQLDKLTLRHQIEGRGKGPDAAQTRTFCETMRRKIRARLKKLDEPMTRPGDQRVYGPAQARWQKAGG